MENLDFTSHPFLLIHHFTKKYGSGIIFEFSKYKYVKNSLLDFRKPFKVQANELTEEYLKHLNNSLEIDEEYALHSKVILGNSKTMHIPMIDFDRKYLLSKWDLIKQVLPLEITREFYIFESGKSHHGYSLHFLTIDEWIDFMGLLLLVNVNSGQKHITDPRWIGHRLRAGYSALRWSHNSGLYIQIPKLYKKHTI